MSSCDVTSDFTGGSYHPPADVYDTDYNPDISSYDHQCYREVPQWQNSESVYYDTPLSGESSLSSFINNVNKSEVLQQLQIFFA